MSIAFDTKEITAKKWDGRVILVNGEWIESLYTPEDLIIGKEVLLPWAGKKGKVQEWKAVLVCPKSSKFLLMLAIVE